MDLNLSSAKTQEEVCDKIVKLILNSKDQKTIAMSLLTAGAHVRIIRAMERHQDCVQVQKSACKALMQLAKLNFDNKVTVAQAATAQIVIMMRLHQTDNKLIELACLTLQEIASHSDSCKALLFRAGADLALMEVVNREMTRLNFTPPDIWVPWSYTWGEYEYDLLFHARFALNHLAGDFQIPWSKLIDRLHINRIELVDLPVWAQVVANRTIEASRPSSSRDLEALDEEARDAVSKYLTELIPRDGWVNSRWRDQVIRLLFPTAEKQVRQAIFKKRQQQ